MLTDEVITRLHAFINNIKSSEVSLAECKQIADQYGLPLKQVELEILKLHKIPLRYVRNIGTLGMDGQITLLSSKAMIVGLGGLGGAVLEELARIGIGTFCGVDPDVFDVSNLNRQLLAQLENLGEFKAQVAHQRIQSINEATAYCGYNSGFSDMPDAAWDGADIVFDCLDNIPDRLTLAKTCSKKNIPLIHGAIAGWYGQVGTIWPESNFLDHIYGNSEKGVEKKIGTPPFTAIFTASIMVSQGVKVLLGNASRNNQNIIFFDLKECEFQCMDIGGISSEKNFT